MRIRVTSYGLYQGSPPADINGMVTVQGTDTSSQMRSTEAVTAAAAENDTPNRYRAPVLEAARNIPIINPNVRKASTKQVQTFLFTDFLLWMNFR